MIKNDELVLLRQMVDDVLTRDSQGHRLSTDGAKSVGREDNVPNLKWPVIVDAGWPGIDIAEEWGGSGGTLAEILVVQERVAFHGVSVPLAEKALASWILADSQRDIGFMEDEVATVAPVRWAERRAVEYHPASRSLRGRVTRVPWGKACRWIVIHAMRDGAQQAFLVDGSHPSINIQSEWNLAHEPRDTIFFEDTPCEPLANTHGWSALMSRGAIMRSASMIGALEAAYELSREHARSRQQFGRPLMRFQTISNYIAVMASELDGAREAVASALAAHERGQLVHEQTAVARLWLARAATEVARLSHQIHGALGVTREHVLHLSTRRLWSWRDEWGSEHEWSKSLGDTALASGAEGSWQTVIG